MILQMQEYEEEIDSSAVLIRHNRGFTSIVRSSSVIDAACDPLSYSEEDTLRAMDPFMVSLASAQPVSPSRNSPSLALSPSR